MAHVKAGSKGIEAEAQSASKPIQRTRIQGLEVQSGTWRLIADSRKQLRKVVPRVINEAGRRLRAMLQLEWSKFDPTASRQTHLPGGPEWKRTRSARAGRRPWLPGSGYPAAGVSHGGFRAAVLVGFGGGGIGGIGGGIGGIGGGLYGTDGS